MRELPAPARLGPDVWRRHPAHPVPLRRHHAPVILFITVSTSPRRELLASPEVHAILRHAWLSADRWCVGYYLLMPDHLHLFAAPARSDHGAIRPWVTYWKRECARALASLRGCWTPDCWDTQLRTQEHYLRKLEYVRENPVRRRLVTHPDDWPHQGQMVDLNWL